MADVFIKVLKIRSVERVGIPVELLIHLGVLVSLHEVGNVVRFVLSECEMDLLVEDLMK